jgi:hypothetical protein
MLIALFAFIRAQTRSIKPDEALLVFICICSKLLEINLSLMARKSSLQKSPEKCNQGVFNTVLFCCLSSVIQQIISKDNKGEKAHSCNEVQILKTTAYFAKKMFSLKTE